MLSDASLRKGRKAEVVAYGIEVQDAEMTVLVPWNNVAYVQFIEFEAKEAPVKSKK